MARSAARRRETGEVFMIATDPFGPLRGTPGGLASAPGPRLAVMPTRLLIIGRGWQDGGGIP